MRDGQAALVSRARNSLVLIRPAARQFASRARPVFVVGIYNLSNVPQDFRVASIDAIQTINGQQMALAVIPYELLVTEERNRQVASAIMVGLAAGANAAAASQAGYYHSNSTVVTPGGVYNVHTTGFSPAASAIAQANASAQNDAMISATIERGQQNLAALEQTVMKDDTLLPGEWYGGTLHLQPPASDTSGGGKAYTLTIPVGTDRHQISIVQEAIP